MTTEEKFNAAVNVIRSLPKNGSYQPSVEMMLKFYAYFKQATEGPCNGPKPAFWDPKGRLKYDAWRKLGDISRDEAMYKYVEELHTIVETMSYSDKVASFLDAPTNELDNLKMEDLQLVVGDVIERIRSQPNSPLASRDASPSRLISSFSTSRSVSPSNDESDLSDGDEFVDTLDIMEPKKVLATATTHNHIPNGYVGHKSRSRTKHLSQSAPDISAEIEDTIRNLQQDMEELRQKVTAMEASRTTAVAVRSKRHRWPFGLSLRTLGLIILWPFVVNLVISRFNRRRLA